MTRQRLRPAYSPAELANVYQQPHDASRWPDHVERVQRSIDFIRQDLGPVERAADLSCGNGAIIDGIEANVRIKGDYAPGYPITGPIEDTLAALEPVDLLICSETLEHLDDPDAVLRLARAKARCLFVSTPVGEATDENPEHYWGWGLDDIADMLFAAGFEDLHLRVLPLGYYTFQLWTAL